MPELIKEPISPEKKATLEENRKFIIWPLSCSQNMRKRIYRI